MEEEIPQWAIERAKAVIDLNGPYTTISNVARYVMQHEKSPPDPDREAISAAVCSYSFEKGRGRIHDDALDVAVAAYRKHKEAGK